MFKVLQSLKLFIKLIKNKIFSNAFKDQKILLYGHNDPIIFDIGSFVGETIAIYRHLFPVSKIYGFEPFEDSFIKVKNRFESDNLITITQKAVSDTQGEKQFFTNTFPATNSLLPRPKSERRYYPKKSIAVNNFKVSSVSIDDFCKEQNIDYIHLLKMDIQGGELLALKGAVQQLKQNKIFLIYTEVQFIPLYEKPPLFHEISKFLSEYGYTLFNIYNSVYAKNGQLKYGDAIFVSPQIRNKVIDSFEKEP